MTRPEAMAWGRGDTRRVPTRDFPAAVLALVEEREGGRFCGVCRAQGLQTPACEPLEVDHRRPLSKGGTNHHLNLCFLCRAHNRSRCNRFGPLPPPTWARGPEGSRRSSSG